MFLWIQILKSHFCNQGSLDPSPLLKYWLSSVKMKKFMPQGMWLRSVWNRPRARLVELVTCRLRVQQINTNFRHAIDMERAPSKIWTLSIQLPGNRLGGVCDHWESLFKTKQAKNLMLQKSFYPPSSKHAFLRLNYYTMTTPSTAMPAAIAFRDKDLST